MKVIMLSGPVGAGKTTVARELVSLLPSPLTYIEGDTFWPFIRKSEGRERRENFHVIMRAMTAATIPFVRSGFTVVLDFSIPPGFLGTARKILKEVPFDYVLLLPSLLTCEARSAKRAQGTIADYTRYRDFYQLFETLPSHTISDDEAEAPVIAKRILDGLNSGVFGYDRPDSTGS